MSLAVNMLLIGHHWTVSEIGGQLAKKNRSKT